jgi:hypothetical protein
MPLAERLTHALFSAALQTWGRHSRDRLLRQAAAPAAVQAATLRAILRRCAVTEQGRRFGLAAITSVEAFRAAVPIQDYEALRPAIQRQIASGALALAPEPPLMYARSSGTTGSPKYLPVTRHVLGQLKAAQRAQSFTQQQAMYCFGGRVLAFAGATNEETLPGGVPAGATSGLIYQTMPRAVRARYVVPPAVFQVADYDLKYRLIARLAAQCADISVIAAANPSSLLRLLDAIGATLPTIATELAAGDCAALADVEPAIAAALRPHLHADPDRAAALQALAEAAAPLTLAALWPDLRSVLAWLGGGCANAAEAVRRQLPPGAAMMDAGYVASELRGTVVVDVARNLALPLLGDVFFEFVPVAAWDAGERDTLLLHQLEPGQDYHVIVTTAAGLLRYHMNDVLHATAPVGATPTLAFLRKGRGVTNITGEKLSEEQVHTAMGRLGREAGRPFTFFILAADIPRARYRAYVELPQGIAFAMLAERLDAALGELNIEYAAKRGSRRLGAVELGALRPGASEAYHRHCVVTKGQREAQAKVLALQDAAELDFDFTPFLIEQPAPCGS